MITYKKTLRWLLLVYLMAYNVDVLSQDCDKLFNQVNIGSKLDCIQGIHSPINDDNPDYSTFIINEGFHFLTLILKGNELDEFIIGYEGFYNFPGYENNYGSFSAVDSFYICDLKQDGPHYISFLEKDIKPSGWVTSLITQPEYFCDSGFIESSDNHLTMYEPIQYLPYQTFPLLYEQGRLNKRDYITEFNILDKLKKAEIIIDKAYFHTTPNERSKRKAFVILGDIVFVDKVVDTWVKIGYLGGSSLTQGWVKKGVLRIIK